MTKIEPDRRLQIPAEWGDEFAPEHEVELVRCEEGILVKPLPRMPLQAALERKLTMSRPTGLDLADVDMGVGLVVESMACQINAEELCQSFTNHRASPR